MKVGSNSTSGAHSSHTVNSQPTHGAESITQVVRASSAPLPTPIPNTTTLTAASPTALAHSLSASAAPLSASPLTAAVVAQSDPRQPRSTQLPASEILSLTAEEGQDSGQADDHSDLSKQAYTPISTAHDADSVNKTVDVPTQPHSLPVSLSKEDILQLSEPSAIDQDATHLNPTNQDATSHNTNSQPTPSQPQLTRQESGPELMMDTPAPAPARTPAPTLAPGAYRVGPNLSIEATEPRTPLPAHAEPTPPESSNGDEPAPIEAIVVAEPVNTSSSPPSSSSRPTSSTTDLPIAQPVAHPTGDELSITTSHDSSEPSSKPSG